jgi:AAA domain, putative AbiEii toxin, Type IV TA system
VQPTIGFRVPPASGAVVPSIDSSASTIVPLAFERVDFKGQPTKLFATLNQNGLQLQPGTALGLVSSFFSNIAMGAPPETANWLSRLRVEKREAEAVDALKRHFDFIRDVTPETSPIGVPMVYADLPAVPRKIPLSLVSAGVYRLFTFILAVTTFKDGVVLIDEIESGIHFKQYPTVWKTLYDLAVHHNTQLFVTTHSDECLQGVSSVMKDHEDDFLLMRISNEMGNSIVHEVDGKFFEASLEGADELR